jgi:hypothetical protein
MIDTAQIKYTFSGHESFQCRTLWLKKGYDYISLGKSFSDEDAVVLLGVGKNMVGSIRFWLKAFNIITAKDEITEFGRRLLNDDGWDPYLEDKASLWLLHYQLVKNNFASTYSILFNEFRRERIEFTRESFVSYMRRRSEVEKAFQFTQNTIEADFDVFRKMYLSNQEESKGTEDSYSGILCDLNLVKTFRKERIEWHEGKEKKIKYDAYYIENRERDDLPSEVFLYAILDNTQYGDAISLLKLDQSYNSPASIFGLSRAGLMDKINEITRERGISFVDHAGIKELQFKPKPNPLTVLNRYYEG